MQNQKFRFYEFGEFRLDARRRILTRVGALVPLKNRHFELLLALVENEGRILSQDEIIEKVWDGAFIENSNIKKGISALRQVLNESPADGAFIKTVPRKGYSFVASVRALPDEAETIFYRESETEVLIEEITLDEETNAPETINNAPLAIVPTIPSQTPSTVLPKFRGRVLILAALLLVGGIGSGLTVWRWLSARAAAFDLNRMQIVPLTSLGNVGGGGVSRSGEWLYFGTKERGGLSSLWLKNLKTGVDRQILPTQKINIYASEFAPDDRSVYLWMVDDALPARSGVYQIGIDDGELHKVTDKEWGAMRFSPDGKRIAYVRRGINEQSESGLFIADPDGGGEQLVSVYDGKFHLTSVDWTPDNRFLTYVKSGANDNQNQYLIAQIPATGGATEIIVPPRSQPIFSAYWMPDGKGLAVSAPDENTKVQQIWHLSYPAGEWRRVTNDSSWYWAARPTADGKNFVVVQQRDIFNLWAGDADGGNFRQITFDTLSYQPDVAWADDETILFAASINGNSDVWEMSADGKNRRQLTFDQSSDRCPQATDGGVKILFLSDRSGTTQIWQMRRGAGDAEAKQVTKAAADIGRFRVLPDGQSIVYSVFLAGKGWSLFRKTIDSDDLQPLPFPNAPIWDVSPDGAQIAYLARTKTGEKVRVATLDENELITEFNQANFNRLVWTRDGKALLYDDLVTDRREIMRQAIAGGEPQRLTDFNSDENIWNFDLSPGSNRLAARRVRQFLDVMLIKLDGN